MMAKKDEQGQLGYSAGDLNTPYEPRISNSRAYVNQDPILVNRRIAEEATVVDPRSTAGPYRGIVVRVEPVINGSHSGAENFATESHLEMNRKAHHDSEEFIEIPTPQFHAYKIFIPELDIVPNPNITLSLQHIAEEYLATHEKIDRLNTFISKDIDIAQAYEGDLVYVDFGNRSSFEDPVYLGPVHKGSGVQRYSPPARPSSAYKALAGKKPSSLSTARNTTDQLPIVATSEKDAEAKVIAAFGSRTKYQAWWKKNHKAGRFKGKDANTYLKVVEQYNKLNRSTGSYKNM